MNAFSFDAVARRLKTRLGEGPRAAARIGSDDDLNDGLAPLARVGELRAAAVLVAVLDRPGGAELLLTERAAHLKRHAGQIAFPGGRCDPGDPSAEAAALREAKEEVGLDPENVELVGRLAPYVTVTGFAVTPVVALVRSNGSWRPDPNEVADVFEAPLAHLMDPAHHEIRSGAWRGAARRYHAISYGGRSIWGATAGMLMDLHRTAFDEASAS